ncbi:MAG TPA: PspC domain-containing protein [Pedobacter sp.]|jgi:phage shock protein PspC (stress-responsive transcriptional regulator)
MEKKLERNEENRRIAGVASGLADYLDLDITLVRVLFVFAFLFGFCGLLIYIVMWIAVPKRSVWHGSSPFKADYMIKEEPLPSAKSNEKSGRVIPGLILILIGLYFLLAEFDILPNWFSIFKLWPIILIIAGITILFRSGANKSHINYNVPFAPQAPDTKTGDQPLA